MPRATATAASLPGPLPPAGRARGCAPPARRCPPLLRLAAARLGARSRPVSVSWPARHAPAPAVNTDRAPAASRPAVLAAAFRGAPRGSGGTELAKTSTRPGRSGARRGPQPTSPPRRQRESGDPPSGPHRGAELPEALCVRYRYQGWGQGGCNRPRAPGTPPPAAAAALPPAAPPAAPPEHCSPDPGSAARPRGLRVPPRRSGGAEPSPARGTHGAGRGRPRAGPGPAAGAGPELTGGGARAALRADPVPRCSARTRPAAPQYERGQSGPARAGAAGGCRRGAAGGDAGGAAAAPRPGAVGAPPFRGGPAASLRRAGLCPGPAVLELRQRPPRRRGAAALLPRLPGPAAAGAAA